MSVGPLAIGLLCKAAPGPLYNPLAHVATSSQRTDCHLVNHSSSSSSSSFSPKHPKPLTLPCCWGTHGSCTVSPWVLLLCQQLPNFPTHEPTSRFAPLQGVSATCPGAVHDSVTFILAQLVQITALSPSHRAGYLTEQGRPRTKAKEAHTSEQLNPFKMASPLIRSRVLAGRKKIREVNEKK